MFKCLLLCLLISCSFTTNAQYLIELVDSNNYGLGEGVVLSKTSFRGLSVVNDQVIWASGSRATIARSIDGGKTFSFQQIKGYEKSDFRDIEAFDDQTAIIMSSGSPAFILKTTDGGVSWKEVYKDTRPEIFLDAMDYWDEKRGVIVGDPIHKHFVLLETKDGGSTWKELDTAFTPVALDSEAIFAASGTSLRCWGKREFGFVTGGSEARLLCGRLNDKNWNSYPTYMAKGKSGRGIFSFARTKNQFFFAGGDYTNDTSSSLMNFDRMRMDGSKETPDIKENSRGYKSCIEWITGKDLTLLVTTGTSGTEICSFQLTLHRQGYRFSTIGEGFHVVRKAKKGKAVFLAGSRGRIARLIY